MAKDQQQDKGAPAPSAGVAELAVIEVKAGAFKDACLQLLDQVHDREFVVMVTKHGTPVAKLVAPDTAGSSAFGFMRGTVLASDDIVAPDLDVWGDLG